MLLEQAKSLMFNYLPTALKLLKQPPIHYDIPRNKRTERYSIATYHLDMHLDVKVDVINVPFSRPDHTIPADGMYLNRTASHTVSDTIKKACLTAVCSASQDFDLLGYLYHYVWTLFRAIVPNLRPWTPGGSIESTNPDLPDIDQLVNTCMPEFWMGLTAASIGLDDTRNTKDNAKIHRVALLVYCPSCNKQELVKMPWTTLLKFGCGGKMLLDPDTLSLAIAANGPAPKKPYQQVFDLTKAAPPSFVPFLWAKDSQQAWALWSYRSSLKPWKGQALGVPDMEKPTVTDQLDGLRGSEISHLDNNGLWCTCLDHVTDENHMFNMYRRYCSTAFTQDQDDCHEKLLNAQFDGLDDDELQDMPEYTMECKIDPDNLDPNEMCYSAAETGITCNAACHNADFETCKKDLVALINRNRPGLERCAFCSFRTGRFPKLKDYLQAIQKPNEVVTHLQYCTGDPYKPQEAGTQLTKGDLAGGSQ